VAAAVDDIERRHWQHKVSIASQVSEVLVQWHSLSQCNAEKKKKSTPQTRCETTNLPAKTAS
jgi:hypothetical protein